MLRPVGCHVAMNHALQYPLEAFHHGTFDVVILAGEDVYAPGLEQPLEGCCAHFSALVALHGQWRLIFHLIQNGLHGGRRLGASLAGQKSCPAILGEYVYATEKLHGAVVGLLVLAAVHQVTLKLFSRPGHDGLPTREAVAHQAVQRVTFLSGQGFPDGRPCGPIAPSWA